MSDNLPAPPSRSCTAFEGQRRLASGPLAEVALAVKAALDRGSTSAVLTFDDATGAVIDLDLRGTKAAIVARLPAQAVHEIANTSEPSPTPRGRGRPRLGVVAREVTLLPRHWDWLAVQRGGASVTLRRLVEAARHADQGRTEARARQEAAYRFMAALAGDLAGFEEATRALFAGSRERFALQTAGWPEDLRDYALKLAFPTEAAAPNQDPG